MIKRLLTVACLLWILDPSASAQNAGRPAAIPVYSDDVAFENLCAPDLYDELYEETPIALNDDQLEKLHIELLERGWIPTFDPDALDADEQLAEAIRGFQAESLLPVTGQPDAATLLLLSVPIETSGGI